MKVVLLCVERGMRMREFSESIPRPRVPVGPRASLDEMYQAGEAPNEKGA